MTTIASGGESFIHQSLRLVRISRLLLLLLLTLPATVLADDYTWTTNNGAITITGYTGPGGDVTIPDTITGMPVTSIGSSAFQYKTSVTNVTIPDSITNIGSFAFYSCTSLTNASIGKGVTSIGGYAFFGCISLVDISIPESVTSILNTAFIHCSSLIAITVDALNSIYSSVDGVLFNKSRTTLIQCPGGKAGTYTIPNSVTNIGEGALMGCTNLVSVKITSNVTSIGNFAFAYSTSLSSVTIGNSVTNIGIYAFYQCFGLTGVYFEGSAPGPGTDSSVFSGDPTTIYYLPGTSGWGATFDDRPTKLWNPQAQTTDGSFGVDTDGFGFNITGTADIPFVVEACTDLANPVWSPLLTNTLTGGSVYFSDADWTNYPARFYRLRSP